MLTDESFCMCSVGGKISVKDKGHSEVHIIDDEEDTDGKNNIKNEEIFLKQLQEVEKIVITKVQWFDKKTGKEITKAHNHDEIILLAQTEGKEGEKITLKIKEKQGKEFEEGITELVFSEEIKQDFSVVFHIQLPKTFKEGILYVQNIENNTSFQEVTLKIEDCVCAGWKDIEPIIPQKKFVGWGYQGLEKNCFVYANHQLKQVGYDLKSKGWYGTSGINPDIFQIYLEKNILNLEKGVQKEAFVQGISYLKTSINNGIPVMVGVYIHGKSKNADKTTDHFVVVVGMGTDEKGYYFIFYDNGDSVYGNSKENKFYCDCVNFKLEGYTDKNNRYSQSKLYKVTQIRKTKKK